MLKRKDVLKGIHLFEFMLINKHNPFLAMLDQLLQLQLKASKAQRELITRLEDWEGQKIASAAVFKAIYLLLKIVDVKGELAAARARALRAVIDALPEFDEWRADKTALNEARRCPAPRLRGERNRCPRQRGQARSHDGKRPWSWRLLPPYRLG